MSEPAHTYRPIHPLLWAGLAFLLGLAFALPFGLAIAKVNAIIEPGRLFHWLPYLGLAFIMVVFVLTHRRQPAVTTRDYVLRLGMMSWVVVAFPIWIGGEGVGLFQYLGMASLLLLLVVPWWFSTLCGPKHFASRRLLFGALYWGGFVLIFRLFPTFNETSQTDVERTALSQTHSSLQLYAVLVGFWLLQIGAVLLVRRMLKTRRRPAQ